ncbi:MAG: hypothetical protein ABW007_18935 [Chitinophagaceae bacterium]
MPRPTKQPAPAPTPAAEPATEETVKFEEGEVLKFLGYTEEPKEVAPELRLDADEFVQVMNEVEEEDGPWYNVSNVFARTGEEDAPQREAIVHHSELRATTPEEDAEVEAAYPKEEGTEENTEGAEGGVTLDGAAAPAGKGKGKGGRAKGSKKKPTMFASLQAALDGGKDVVKFVIESAKAVEQQSFDIGGGLLIIKEDKLFAKETDDAGNAYSDDLTGFNKFVEDRVGISARQAHYWITNAKMLRKIAKHEPRLLDMSWQRLAAITRAYGALDAKLKPEEAAKALLPLVDLASQPGITDKAIKDEVTTNWVKATETTGSGTGNTGSGPVQKQTRFMADLYGDQGELVAKAIEDAGKRAGKPGDKAAALLFIVDYYMSSQGAEPLPETPVAETAAAETAAAETPAAETAAPVAEAAKAPAATPVATVAKKAPAKKAVTKK